MGHRNQNSGIPPVGEQDSSETQSSQVAAARDALRSHPVLGVLPEQAIDDIASHGEIVPRRANRMLISEGEPARWLFFLLEGRVRVFHQSPVGDQVLLKIFSAPALFGDIEVLADLPYQEYAQCLTNCCLLRVPAQVFTELLKSQPDLSIHILRDLAVRFCLATNNEKNLAFKLLQPRLARMLLDYAQAFGNIEAPNGLPSVVLNQTAVARDLAISRQHAVKSLRSLVNMKLLGRQGSRYVLLDVARLTRLAGGVMSYLYQLKQGREQG